MSAGGIFVDRFAHALGETPGTVESAEAGGRLTSSAAALRTSGFDRHHVCEPGTTTLDLARRAVAAMDGPLTGVGAIVYVTCVPRHGSVGDDAAFAATGDVKHLMDFPGSRLQAELGLPDAVVIGLTQQACAGTLGALQVARGLLLAEPEVASVLCVAADRFPEGARYEQAYNLMSDGATACVVSREPAGFRLLSWHACTNGALAFVSDDEAVGSFFGHTHRAVHAVLAKAGLTLADLACIVPQNMNRLAWQILARLLPFDPERVLFPTLPEIGHLVCGDNFINLRRLVDEGRVASGDRVLLFMAGYGLNWQCAILEKV